MSAKVIYSTKKAVADVVADLKGQLAGFDCRLLQVYASPSISPHELSAELYEALGRVPTLGCTTSGEIISGRMLEGSVVAMALDSAIVEDLHIEVLEHISTEKPVERAFEAFKGHFGEDLATLDPSKHIGLVLIDGLSKREETINERIGDLTNISFVGGSAGDDLAFKATHLFANGECYTDAAVLCLIKSRVKFDILKTQSFISTQQKLTVTAVDEENRCVIEFNGKPALEEYHALSGCKDGKCDVNANFSAHPVGLDIGDDYFVRSPRQADGSKLQFYCAMHEGMELELLEAQDIVEDTKKALDQKLKAFGPVSALINFNCILRTLELRSKQQTKAYGELFAYIPTVGFSSYGESYIGHINQTAVMLLFGE
ncbi:MAG: hypothetical protein CSA97_00410 [Bacteroidetes bacterium]|nr:MAG: hypothetical protein CSA97_00410 [Bacteroidota bacterium]